VLGGFKWCSSLTVCRLNATLQYHIGLSIESITVVTTIESLHSAMRHLRSCSTIGFDTESTPSFRKGVIKNGPHLVQLATIDRAYLFPIQFSNNEFQKNFKILLKDILQSESVRKVGFGLGSDKYEIFKKFESEVNNIVDLSYHLRENGSVNQVGTKTAVTRFLNVELKKSKSISTSIWGMPIERYSKDMIAYAANDAHVALLVYNEWRKQIDAAKATNCSIDGFIDWSYHKSDKAALNDLQKRVMIQ
jgi:RNA polymerase sigma factor for flagellar operon FliA